jgi:hypothetical protein
LSEAAARGPAEYHSGRSAWTSGRRHPAPSGGTGEQTCGGPRHLLRVVGSGLRSVPLLHVEWVIERGEKRKAVHASAARCRASASWQVGMPLGFCGSKLPERQGKHTSACPGVRYHTRGGVGTPRAITYKDHH